MKSERWLTVVSILPVVWASWAGAAEVVETFPNGKVQLRYQTDKDGHKQGQYVEYYETGKARLRTAYKADKLNGPYTSYWESGEVQVKAAYVDGMREGAYQENDEQGGVLKEQVYWQDRVLYPRTVRVIRETLEAIQRTPAPGAAAGSRPRRPPRVRDVQAGALSDPNNLTALRRLNSYRFLAGVPHDVTLSAEFCDFASAAADICARTGSINHHPANPGMPEDQYRKALNGTTHANLSMGGGTRSSVDAYMHDSDPRNIRALGHRRWCLNPAMLQVGFGESGRFSAMYAHDGSRRGVTDYDYVAFPPPGYMVLSYFSPTHAWNVSLSRREFARPDRSTVKVAVYPLGPGSPGRVSNPKQRDAALELDYFNVDLAGYGISNSIIWRPKGLSLTPGARYWVEITGLKKPNGTPAVIEYLVEFIQL